MNHRYYIAYLFLQSFFPLCILLGHLMGMSFVLANQWVYLIAVSGASIVMTLAIWKGGPSYFAIPAPLLSILHGLIVLFSLPQWGAGLAAVVFFICGWAVFSRTPKGVWKIFALIPSFLLSLVIVLVSPLLLFAMAMGGRTEVQRLDSPGGTYTAIVTDVDQGALGGDTLVEVRDNSRTLNVLVGSFVCVEEVYRGNWGEWQDMELEWEGEEVLSINGTACSVDSTDISAISETAAELGVAIHKGVLLEHTDSHGGFLGDGLTVIKIQGSVSIPDSIYWHSLPLTGSAARIPTYLDIDDPIPEKGAYFFRDRHSQSTDSADSSPLFSRYSCNFTFALWDSENGILYYYKIDT